MQIERTRNGKLQPSASSPTDSSEGVDPKSWQLTLRQSLNNIGERKQPDNTFGEKMTRPEGDKRSAQEIIDADPTLKFLGDQTYREGKDGPDISIKEKLKERVGDFTKDPDAAYRASEVLKHIEQFDSQGARVSGNTLSNGKIDGFTSKGDARNSTESGRLQDFAKFGFGSLKGNHQNITVSSPGNPDGDAVNEFGKDQTRPAEDERSAEQIKRESPLLANLGNQSGVRDMLKAQVGDFDKDPDAAYRAVKVLEHIEKWQADGKLVETDFNKTMQASTVGNGVIDGFTKSGEAKPDTEAGRLQDFGKYGYASLKSGGAPDEGESGETVPSGAGVGAVLPSFANSMGGDAGSAGVDPDIAKSILDNVAEGKPPFKPEAGNVGGVSWFVTDGNPYVGSSEGKVTIPVDVKNTSGKAPEVFDERRLKEIFSSREAGAKETAEAQMRDKTGKTHGEPLNNRQRGQVASNAARIAEKEMWIEVGETVKNSESGIGKVKLENSQFSKSGNGEFTLTSKAENVNLQKGAAARMLEGVKAGGAGAQEPGLMESAEKLASKEKWAGKVQSAFKIGGKVLIVVGIAADTYKIYTAEDKGKATAEVVGGWAGATAGASAFAAGGAGLLAAGPAGAVLYGVGSLVAGGVGYAGGSWVGGKIYDLVASNKPPVELPA